MSILRIALLILLCPLALCRPALGQAPTPDSTLAATIAAARQQYTASFVAPPQLYSGPEYANYAKRYHTSTGDQFFLSAEPQEGRVHYNNHDFPHVRFTYDVVRDQLVFRYPTSPQTLRLVNERVDSFRLAGHRFVRLVADSTTRGLPRTGYYEVLTGGPTQLLARRAKQLQEQLQQPYINALFISSDKLLIRKGSVYFPANSKKAVLRLFADHASEVKRHVQQQKLRFKKAQFEATVVELTRYYNSLPPPA